MARTDKTTIRYDAMRRMLRPLVRYWIGSFDTIQGFYDLLKEVFVEVSVEEMQKSGSKVNVSRISVMTGIHRIDVTKIYKQDADYGHSVPDIITRVVGKWQAHDDYITKDGKPRVLTYGTDDSEFVALIKSLSKAVSPGSVVFELERAGAIKKTAKGLSLINPSFRMTKNIEKVTDLMARDMESLITAVQENIDAGGDLSPNHHIRTEYDNIYVRDLPKIRNWFRREGKKFHKRVRDYLSKYDKDIVDKPDKAGAHVSFSGFSLITEPPEEPAKGDDN